MVNWIESTAYVQWVLAGAWGYPIMLVMHAIGLAMILGVMFLVNLRLLGIYHTIPYTSLHDLMRIAWTGIGINIFSGVSIFLTQIPQYLTSAPFLFKMFMIICGIVNLAYMQKTLRLQAAGWETTGEAPPIAQGLAWSSLFFWITAVVTGRLIAYI